MKYLLLIIIGVLITCSSQLLAQQKEITGIVKDAPSHKTIPLVHIIVGNAGTYSDLNGKFTIRVDETDTIHFSHVNYSKFEKVVSQIKNDTFQVFLLPHDLLLEEIVIREFPTEENFKSQMLETNPRPTIEKVNATINLEIARRLLLSGYIPKMDSEDNFRNYMRGPQDVSIFSTGPNKGIGKAIKNVARYKSLMMPLRSNSSPMAPGSNY